LKNLEKILFVDDEGDIRTVAKIALERVGGFEVKAEESAEKALQRLNDWQPDLLLLDVMMPGMGGPALFSQLQTDERYKDLPVVFMTAKAQPKEVDDYRELGVLDVIPKPFDPFTLATQLQAIWMRFQEDRAATGNG